MRIIKREYDLKTGADRWVVTGLSAAPCTTPAPGPDGNLYAGVWNNGSANEPNIPPWDKFLEMMDKDKDGKLSPMDCEGTIFGDLFTTIDHNRNGKIYAISQRGVFICLKAGRTPSVLWKADFGEPIVTTPLVTGNTVYLRSQDHVWAFAE